MLDGFTLVARALRKFFALGLLGVPRPVRRAGAIRVALLRAARRVVFSTVARWVLRLGTSEGFP